MHSQKSALYKGVHVIVGTPGRVKDMIQRQFLSLANIDYVILDEADEMLKIGFKDDVEEILSNIPKEKDRQTLLFSATLPGWVKNIVKSHMKPNHITIDLVKEQKTTVSDTITYYATPIRGSYVEVLESLHGIYAPEGGRSIVFCGTKAGCSQLASQAKVSGKAMAIHGDINQALREQTLDNFRNGRFSTLIATNVAARGLDIPKVDLVVQIGLPQVFEDFVHRSGRTGRAGRKGICILAYLNKERDEVARLAKQTGIKFQELKPPTSEDKIVSLMVKAKASVEEVDPNMSKRFVKTAKELIESKGAEAALASALAHIAGYAQEPLGRSLLNWTVDQGNYTTLKFTKDVSSAKELEAEVQMLGIQPSKLLWGPGESYVDVPIGEARQFLNDVKEFSIAKNIPNHLKGNMEREQNNRGGNRGGFGGRNGGGGGGWKRNENGGGYGGNRGNGGGFGGNGGGNGGYGGGYGGGNRGNGGGYGSGTSFASSQRNNRTTFE